MDIHDPGDISRLQDTSLPSSQNTGKPRESLIGTIRKVNQALGSDRKLSDHNVETIKDHEESILSMLKNRKSITGKKIVHIVKLNRQIKLQLSTDRLFRKISCLGVSDANRPSLRRISSNINSINSHLSLLVKKTDPKALQAIPQEIISTLNEITDKNDITVISDKIDYIKGLLLIGASVIDDADFSEILDRLQDTQHFLVESFPFESIKYPFSQLSSTLEILNRRPPSSFQSSVTPKSNDVREDPEVIKEQQKPSFSAPASNPSEKAPSLQKYAKLLEAKSNRDEFWPKFTAISTEKQKEFLSFLKERNDPTEKKLIRAISLRLNRDASSSPPPSPNSTAIEHPEITQEINRSRSPTSVADEIPEATKTANLSSLMENKELSDFVHTMLQIDPNSGASVTHNADNTYTFTSNGVSKEVTKTNITDNFGLGMIEKAAIRNSSSKETLIFPSSLTFSIEKKGSTITLTFPKPQESLFLFSEGEKNRKSGIKELQYDTKKDNAKMVLYQARKEDSSSWKDKEYSSRDIGSIKPQKNGKGAYAFWQNLKTAAVK